MSSSEFKTAAQNVLKLATKPTQEEQLKIYGLFKQATVGEINIAQPWSIQVEARAKWDAWKAQSGKSQDQAEQEYIAYAAELVSTYGLSQ